VETINIPINGISNKEISNIYNINKKK